MTFTPHLSEEEQKIVDQIKSLPQDSFYRIFPHITLIDQINRIENESLHIKEVDLWLGEGRHKAMYYARMSLSNAELEKERAMERIHKIQQNWDNMKKDQPISWFRDKLVGDINIEEREGL